MKKHIKILASILLVLIFSVEIAYAHPMNGYDYISYKARLEVDEDGFSQMSSNYKDWKEFLEKFSLTGFVQYADLFNKDEIIDTYNKLFINDKLMLDFDVNGNQQFYWVHSDALNQRLHFNANNYYEFMLKGYFFLNLPTQKIAVLTYPFGLYSAFKPFSDFIKEYIDPIDHDMTIPYAEIQKNISNVKQFLDTNYISYQFFRSATMESGISDIVYYDFTTADEYLASFADGQDMHISVQGNSKIFEIAGYEIIKYTKSEDEFDIKINLPQSLNGIAYVCNINLQKSSNNNYNVDATLSLNMDESEYLRLYANATDLPIGISKKASGDINISVSGDGLGTTENLRFKHNIEDLGDNKYKIKFSYIDPSSNKEIISILADTEKVKFRNERRLHKEAYSDEDYFSVNDQSIKNPKEALKVYAKKALIPLLVETPTGVLNDIFDFVDNNGLLSMMLAK